MEKIFWTFFNQELDAGEAPQSLGRGLSYIAGYL